MQSKVETKEQIIKNIELRIARVMTILNSMKFQKQEQSSPNQTEVSA